MWSNGAARDRLHVRATGPDCANADVAATITNAEGVEILRTPVLGHAMAMYGDNQPSPLPPVSATQMTAYVDSIATSAWILTAGELPAWPSGQRHLPRATEGASYDTHLARDAYETLRIRNVRVLCLETGPEAASCFAYDHAARRAFAIASYGV
jgi:hypothetical protein